jgi:hypothetical protein
LTTFIIINEYIVDKNSLMDRLILLQFCLLLLTVPLQYFVLTKWSSKDIEQAKTITQLIFF